jgi:hypothetical protein
MDLDPRLMIGVERIRDALHRFASSKGWKPEDYRIFMNVNKDWETFSVEIIAKEYGRWIKDEVGRGRFDEVLDFLEGEFVAEPDLLDSINLTLGGFEGYTWFLYPRPSLPPSIVQVDDAYLNPDVADSRGNFRRDHERKRKQHGL